jgi:threonine dehydratase
MIPIKWINEAIKRIHPYIKRTPLTFDPENNLYIKWENRQITGSFKARGALNKVLSLEPWERNKGIVAASAGNHGQGVALAGKLSDTSVIVFVPEQTPKVKIEAIRNLGADVRITGGGYENAENEGIRYAASIEANWVSPYNDGQVIAGQGTIAIEILDELTQTEDMSWIIPASGGGLTAGIGVALESSARESRLVSVQSETSPFLHSIYHQGSQEGALELPTIAEGLAGPVEIGSVTIPIIKRVVDDFLLVSEDQIEYAIAYCWYKYGEKIEGAAAVSLAAILNDQVQDRPAILIISGGNIQSELHQEIIRKYSKKDMNLTG